MKRFTDFAQEGSPFDGEKVKLSSILNKEICILQFKIKKSKYQDKGGFYAIIQFTETDENGEHKIVFTGSGVIMDMLERYKNELPFATAIRKIDKYYTLT